MFGSQRQRDEPRVVVPVAPHAQDLGAGRQRLGTGLPEPVGARRLDHHQDLDGVSGLEKLRLALVDREGERALARGRNEGGVRFGRAVERLGAAAAKRRGERQAGENDRSHVPQNWKVRVVPSVKEM